MEERLALEFQSASIRICSAEDIIVTQLIAGLLYRRNRKHPGYLRGLGSQDIARFSVYPCQVAVIKKRQGTKAFCRCEGGTVQ